MLGAALSEECQYEKDNKPWLKPIDSVGIPQITKGDKLHHKFGIIDRNIIIAGSHNWSASANYKNDETLLIIQNSIVTAHYLQEFERLYQHSTLGLSPFVRQKIQENAQKCPVHSTPQAEVNSPSLVNINTASKTELESLPGIGEKTAENIIKARKETPFTALEDLNRVPGIGDSRIKQLQDKVTW